MDPSRIALAAPDDTPNNAADRLAARGVLLHSVSFLPPARACNDDYEAKPETCSCCFWAGTASQVQGDLSANTHRISRPRKMAMDLKVRKPCGKATLMVCSVSFVRYSTTTRFGWAAEDVVH